MTAKYFALLSDEILILIFLKLDSRSLFRISAVSRSWRCLAWSPQLLHHIVETNHVLRQDELFDGDVRQALAWRMHRCRKYSMHKLFVVGARGSIWSKQPPKHLISGKSKQNKNITMDTTTNKNNNDKNNHEISSSASYSVAGTEYVAQILALGQENFSDFSPVQIPCVNPLSDVLALRTRVSFRNWKLSIISTRGDEFSSRQEKKRYRNTQIKWLSNSSMGTGMEKTEVSESTQVDRSSHGEKDQNQNDQQQEDQEEVMSEDPFSTDTQSDTDDDVDAYFAQGNSDLNLDEFATDHGHLAADLVPTPHDESSRRNFPFYYFWHPTCGTRLSYLMMTNRNDHNIVLMTAHLDRKKRISRIYQVDSGIPYFYDMSKRDDRIVSRVGCSVNIGQAQIRVIDANSLKKMVISDSPANFTAPQWINYYDNQDFILYATTHTDQDHRSWQRLYLTKINDTGLQIRYILLDRLPQGSNLSFEIAPDFKHVAVLSDFDDDSVLKIYPIDMNQLPRLEFSSACAEQWFLLQPAMMITPVSLFSWNPPGDRLLLLNDDHEWSSVNCEVLSSSYLEKPSHHPQATNAALSKVFTRYYLVHFQQYSKSLSLWRADGRAFCYCKTDGAWIQDLARDQTLDDRVSSEAEFITFCPAPPRAFST